MPHCIIEYSSDFHEKRSDLINAVYQGAWSSQLFEKDDIKTRTISFDDYLVGESQRSFIHVTVKILSGRNDQQKLALTKVITNHVNELGLSDCFISIEVVDIHRESYSKYKV